MSTGTSSGRDGGFAFMGDPERVLRGYMSSIGRPHDVEDYEFGKMALLLELMTRAHALLQAGLIVEASGLEAMLQEHDYDRVWRLYQKLWDWHRTGFISTRGTPAELASPLSYASDASSLPEPELEASVDVFLPRSHGEPTSQSLAARASALGVPPGVRALPPDSEILGGTEPHDPQEPAA